MRANLSAAEKFSVLVHEFAHELLHQGERKHETSRTARETEAGAVAYVVGRASGVDSATRLTDYIQLYRGDATVLGESLEFIQKTAARIVAGLKPTAYCFVVRSVDGTSHPPRPRNPEKFFLRDVRGNEPPTDIVRHQRRRRQERTAGCGLGVNP